MNKELEQRKIVKKEIEIYLKMHKSMNREPESAFFYDGSQLVFVLYDTNTQKSYLGSNVFSYWETKGIIGKRLLEDEWESLLKEIGLNMVVNEMTYFDEIYDEENYERLSTDDFYIDLNNTNFTTELVGTQYEGRNDRIEKVKIGDIVELIREPNNTYDYNSIDVRNKEGSLGHISSFLAQKIAPLIDQGCNTVAEVVSVTPLSLRSKKCKNALLSVKITIDYNSLK